jgi:arylformamidase
LTPGTTIIGLRGVVAPRAARRTPLDWLDISVPVEPGMPTFEGDPEVRLELVLSLAAGDVCDLTRLDLGAHSGTHLDAPCHFLAGGASSEAIPLEALLGPVWVVDATSQQGSIVAADLDRLEIPAGESRLLFKTSNSDLWRKPGFQPGFIALDQSAAVALARRGAALVGVDYLSVAPFGNPGPTHRALLGAGIVVLEGLDLGAVAAGPYELLCLPIRLVGSDGVPARALVRPRQHRRTG